MRGAMLLDGESLAMATQTQPQTSKPDQQKDTKKHDQGTESERRRDFSRPNPTAPGNVDKGSKAEGKENEAIVQRGGNAKQEMGKAEPKEGDKPNEPAMSGRTPYGSAYRPPAQAGRGEQATEFAKKPMDPAKPDKPAGDEEE